MATRNILIVHSLAGISRSTVNSSHQDSVSRTYINYITRSYTRPRWWGAGADLLWLTDRRVIARIDPTPLTGRGPPFSPPPLFHSILSASVLSLCVRKIKTLPAGISLDVQKLYLVGTSKEVSLPINELSSVDCKKL